MNYFDILTRMEKNASVNTCLEYLLKIWPFTTRLIGPKAHGKFQSRFKIFTNIEQTLQNLPNIFVLKFQTG